MNFARSTLLPVFNFACIAATVAMVGFWCYQYVQDDDLSLIDYTEFEAADDLYPVLSMCFEEPILDKKLNESHPNLNQSYYLKFLKGEIYDEKLRNIDYDNVTMNIMDYVEDYDVVWQNGTKLTYDGSNPVARKIPYVTYSGFHNRYLVKCFGTEFQMEHLKYVRRSSSVYNQSIYQNFPNGSRPTDGRFSTFFHYPNQFLLSMSTGKYGWRSTVNNGKSNYNMSFTIKLMEVLRRRDKRKEPCLTNWKKFDESVMTHTQERIGCRAPYQTQYRTDLPICAGKQEMQMQQAQFNLRTIITKNVTPPCVALTVIDVAYSELDWVDGSDLFTIMLKFPSQLRHITQAKDISFHSLVGNSGGYVGLFMGEYWYLISFILLYYLIPVPYSFHFIYLYIDTL